MPFLIVSCAVEHGQKGSFSPWLRTLKQHEYRVHGTVGAKPELVHLGTFRILILGYLQYPAKNFSTAMGGKDVWYQRAYVRRFQIYIICIEMHVD